MAARAAVVAECFDPAFQALHLGGDQLWLAERRSDQHEPFVGGHERVCQVASVAPPELAKLGFDPANQSSENRRDRVLAWLRCFISSTESVPIGHL